MSTEIRCVSGLHSVNSTAPCAKCSVIRRKIWNSTRPREAQAIYNVEHATELAEAAAYCAARENAAIEAGITQIEMTKRKLLASEAARREANQSQRRAYSNNARALRIRAEGLLSDNLLDRLYKLQKGKCPCCRKPLGKDFHMDHIVPVSKGGPNSDENIQLLRSRCNLVKSAMDPVLFMQLNGFLI